MPSLHGDMTEVDMDEIVNKMISAFSRVRLITYIN